MIEFLSTFIAVIVAFIAGMLCAPERKPKPIEEPFIGEPPPWHLEKPTVVTHLYAPWKK